MINLKGMDIQHMWSLLAMTIALTAFVLIAKRRYLDKAKEASTEQDELVKSSSLVSASFVKKLTELVIRKENLYASIKLLTIIEILLSIAVLVVATNNTMNLFEAHPPKFLIAAAVILVDISLILLFFSMMKEWFKSFKK